MTESEAKTNLEQTRVLWGRGAKTEIVESVKVAIQALEEIQKYLAFEERLKKIYGDYPDLLELVVKHLETHGGVDIQEPVFKARLLTDGEMDKWDAYKQLGTVEELLNAMEKQTKKKVIQAFDESVSQHWCSCPVCAKGLGWEHNTHVSYCPNCGQAIDWSEEG